METRVKPYVAQGEGALPLWHFVSRSCAAWLALMAIGTSAQASQALSEPGQAAAAAVDQSEVRPPRPAAAYRKFSDNAKTNERLNAVFALIHSEGDGRTWVKRPDVPIEQAEDPVRVAAKPVSVKGTSSNDQNAQAAGKAEPQKPEPMPVFTFAFKPNATARETLSAWAKLAGWNEPKWNATNAFQGSGEVRGTFLDALRAMAAAAPQLDFHASLDAKTITVTDARAK